MLGVTNELIKKLTYITYLSPSSLLPFFFFPFPNLTTEKSSYLTLISKHPRAGAAELAQQATVRDSLYIRADFFQFNV
jgi:hypothetical protein